MSKLRANINQLDEAAAQFDSLNKGVKDYIGKLSSTITEIDASWDGRASEIYILRLRAMLPVMRNMAEALKAFKDYANNTKILMQEVDRLIDAAAAMLVQAGLAGGAAGTAAAGGAGVNLKPNMGAYSLNQNSYATFKKPYGYNAGCCATAYATGLSIVNGKSYDPTSFWNTQRGQTQYSAGQISGYYNWDADSYQKIAGNLANGKPTMMHFKHNLYQDGEHWVLITGIKEGADKNNLKPADFIVIDPADGQTKSWQQICDSYKGYRNDGFKMFN